MISHHSPLLFNCRRLKQKTKQKSCDNLFCLVLFHSLSKNAKPNNLVNGVKHMTQKNTDNRDWHRADIVAALKKRGKSVRKFSVEAGLSPNTLKSAL